MEKIIITLKDSHKKKFFFELLRNLDFIEFEEKPASLLKKEIKEAVEEVNSLKTKDRGSSSFDDLLNEL